MAKFSSIGRYTAEHKDKLAKMFEERRLKMSSSMDGACRKAMMLTILKFYYMDLVNSSEATRESNLKKVDAAILEIKKGNPYFLSEMDWNDIYNKISFMITRPQTTLKNRIKNNFCMVLPKLVEDPYHDFSDVRKSNLSDEFEFTKPSMETLNFDEQTCMYVDGYFEVVAAVVRSACTDVWFKAL